jgi:hypothetical protein
MLPLAKEKDMARPDEIQPPRPLRAFQENGLEIKELHI